MVTDIYKAGQQAFERCETFLEHNPYPCTDERHFEWSAGWFERNHYYEKIHHEAYLKENEEEAIQILKEKEAEEKKKEIKKAEKKFEKSKKGKAEAAGQKTLF